MRFDWYEVTAQAEPDEVVGEMLARTDGLGIVRPFRGKTHGYERAYEIAQGEDVRGVVMWGGEAQGAGVHARATGSEAPWFADLCRARWPHQVTRVDAAEDFDAVGAFDRLVGVGMEVCRVHRLKTRNNGDWAQGKDGRTLTFGSPTSTAQVRVYEKGYEQRQKGREDASLDWARLEAQLRPKKAGREVLSRASPEECWGLSTWTRDLLHKVTGLEVPKLADVEWQPADDARAYTWLLKQYGPLLTRMRERHGSWEAVGRVIGTDLAEPRSEER